MQQPKQDEQASKSDKDDHSNITSSSISFVSFDANPTQEARKAVRKQAALASAAARKATIARKIARLKEEDATQAENSKEKAAGSKTKRKRTSPEPPRRKANTAVKYIAQPEVVTEIDQGAAAQERRKLIKWPAGVKPQKGFPNFLTIDPATRPNEESGTLKQHTACISPAGSIHDDSQGGKGDQLRLASPCRCLACRTASAGQGAKPGSPWSNISWPVLSDDYGKLGVRPLSPALLPIPHSMADGKFDPFAQYPVEYHPLFDKLLHHMLTVFAPRGWPALKITRAEGLEWEGWMTEQGFKEPAFFYVRLFFACGDLIRLRQLDQKVADWLRSLAISCINDALSDPRRSISDGLILAVGRIALTESMYGDRNAATRIHRPAQKRMIDLRGGMAKLPFPALVKKLMRWADNVMAVQSGTDRILGETDDSETIYGAQKSAEALEKWVPQEGRAMRKKIAISDLIT